MMNAQAELFPENDTWEGAKNAEVLLRIENTDVTRIYKGEIKLIKKINKIN